ncbi:MAG: 3D (Asp-Asp-Asp) domain-containing protein [Phycisphaerales bacterium]|jgi:3D (Asp-Asp-Asp) domain-containing protein
MRAAEGFVFTIATALVVISAILTKQAAVHGERMMTLARLDSLNSAREAGGAGASVEPASPSLVVFDQAAEDGAQDFAERADLESAVSGAFGIETRWFDGRPVRPARVLWMTVTGYSPDERSCGEFADGQTATLHSVWTNGMRIVAADTDVLAYGSMLTVPGYGDDSVVPVLDCGGAIKGSRLDVLFATHNEAMRWGVRRLPVVVWEYVDGEPAPNPREVR